MLLGVLVVWRLGGPRVICFSDSGASVAIFGGGAGRVVWVADCGGVFVGSLCVVVGEIMLVLAVGRLFGVCGEIDGSWVGGFTCPLGPASVSCLGVAYSYGSVLLCVFSSFLFGASVLAGPVW